MSFYIFIFSLCVLLFLFNLTIREEQRKYLEFFTLFILCITSGTRYELGGTDYFIYETTYNSMPALHQFFSQLEALNVFSFEIGYLFVNSLFKTLGISFYGFTLIHSFVFYFCLYYGLKRYTHYFGLLIIVFLYKLFFYNTFISMRQSITIALFFVLLRFIEEEKPIKYYIGTLFAVLFHNGAYLLLLLYFVNKVKISRKRIIILNLIFIPTLAFNIFDLSILRTLDGSLSFLSGSVIEKVGRYFGDGSSINIIHTLEYLLLMLLVLLNYEKIIEVNPRSEFILKLFLLLLPLFTLLRGSEILTREKDYFTFTYAVILGYMCNINQLKFRYLIIFATIIVCAFGFFRFILLFDDQNLIPYESWLFKNDAHFLLN